MGWAVFVPSLKNKKPFQDTLMKNTQQSICALICQSDGIKARDIAKKLDLDHKTVNRALYTSPLMKVLC